MHRINLEFTKKIDSENQVLIKGLFTDQKLDSFFNEADNKHITSAINVEGYKAEYKKTLDLYSNSMAKRVSVFGLGKKNKLSNDRLRALSADIIRKFDNRNISTLTIDAKSFNLTEKDAAQAFMEGIVLGQYKFFNYKSKIKYKLNVKTINFIGECDSEALEKGRIVGYGVNYARDLGNHPPNIQTPQNLSDQAVEISKSVSKMKSTIGVNQSNFSKLFGFRHGKKKNCKKQKCSKWKGGKCRCSNS